MTSMRFRGAFSELRPSARAMHRSALALLLALVSAGMLGALGAPPALGAAAWWQLGTESAPTNLPPEGQGQINVVASNLGDAPINGSGHPVIITDRLPSGLTATGTETTLIKGVPVECTITTLVSCTYAGILNPYEQISVGIKVRVEEPAGTVASLSEQASVEGGGAPPVERSFSLNVNGQPATFGVADYELTPFNEDGTPANQAGSHPFQLTTTLALNQTAERYPVALPKDLSFQLPPGLVGNPNAATQCTMTDFALLVEEANLCPPSSAVGVASVVAHEPLDNVIIKTVPVFNLVPSVGEPARFGFEVLGKIPVVIDTSVRSGSDYSVVATVKDATETAGLLRSQVTLWGVPAEPSHDDARGWECVAGGYFQRQVGKPCPATDELQEQPFLTLPTSCAADPTAEPVISSAEADSWAQPGRFLGAEYAWMNESGQLLGFEGCSQLPFSPEIDVTPEEHSAATPTGLQVKVSVPQKTTLEAGALAESDVRDTSVTLPAGVELSPSAANGLEACSEAQIGFEGFNSATQTNEFTDAQPDCPDASKLGTVKIKTPLLTHELEGSVYLASPAPNGEASRNPFGSLVALYLVAEDPVSGVLVKLAGEGRLNEQSLTVATSFHNAPQVPFEELTLNLFGGPRASLSTPALCGSYSSEASFTPWSGTPTVDVGSPPADFAITSGVGGSGCPGSEPFSPGMTAGVSNGQAGAFTTFDLELTRPDGNQALKGLTVHLPAGVAAMLSSVELCSEAQASADACPPGSEVGKATAIAGLGQEPYVEEGGRVYITGPYQGAPFGLEILTPAVAGPFNLGYVSVRSKISVDPNDASITIQTPELPTQLKGVPLQLKRVLVDVNRPGFEFNPTNCTPAKIEGKVYGSEGASESLSSPLEIGGCGSLPFAPRLSAVAGGRGSKADGTSLDVKVESGGVNSGGVAQAGIAKVDLQLPVALSSRLSTLQKACTEAVFAANPASCSEGSVIGFATIYTPVLSKPLSGPAYLVSHGGAAFPDVEFVLQGEGITLVLDGKTDIKAGVTYSRFESAPDAPFTVFETVLPAGPHGVLTANVPERQDYSLCKASLLMPTEITGQNGAVINQTTPIAVSGCAGVKSEKTVKLTRAQLLARALKACRSRHKHSRAKRIACERQARKRFRASKAAHKTSTHKSAHRSS